MSFRDLNSTQPGSLTYTPDQVDKDGGFHKIALKANKDDLSVVTREGYYAPAEK